MPGSPVTSGLLANRSSLLRIGDDEDLGLVERVGAEGLDAGRLLRFGEADLGLEPLAVLIDQRDERDGRAANLRGHGGEVVEFLLGRGLSSTAYWRRTLMRCCSRKPGTGLGGVGGVFVDSMSY